MRELLRGMVKARWAKLGVNKVNRRIASNWRKEADAYPGFIGAKYQRKGSKQPVLIYPVPRNEMKRPA